MVKRMGQVTFMRNGLWCTESSCQSADVASDPGSWVSPRMVVKRCYAKANTCPGMVALRRGLFASDRPVGPLSTEESVVALMVRARRQGGVTAVG